MYKFVEHLKIMVINKIYHCTQVLTTQKVEFKWKISLLIIYKKIRGHRKGRSIYFL